MEDWIIPVCKKCHNYVMNLPCAHCGSDESLAERTEKDFSPVIPKNLQYDFDKADNPENIYIPSSPQEIYQIEKPDSAPNQISTARKRVSQNIPLESIFPPLNNVKLDPASLKVYFQLSIEFQIILDKATNYREGLHRWNMLLPDRLQAYGLTPDAWDRISSLGDSDERIQEQLNEIIKRIFG